MQFGLWKRPRVVAGRVYVIKDVGVVRVTAVEKIDLGRLTPWEAEAAGAKDVKELRSWLLKDNPDTDIQKGQGYRVRFRYLGPEEEHGNDTKSAEEGADEKTGEKPSTPSPVPPKPVPPDLMAWLDKRPWRQEHLSTLSSGVWRNAEDISRDLGVDSATTRRRMGDLRKRGLVTSHRHHGYRITPEGQGALARLVDEDVDGAGTTAAVWLRQKEGRIVILNVLKDGRWHNASEIGETMDLSVVSVQRRVAALRDRGLVESHRRRGYRLTDVGFEALGLMPDREGDPAPGVTPAPPGTPVGEAITTPRWGEAVREEPLEPEVAIEPIDSKILVWLEARPYRKDLLLAIPPDEYISSSELSEILLTSVTAIHGRLNTLKARGLVGSLPRRGYIQTPLGMKTTEIISAMARRRRSEPEGASAFLSAEPETWTDGSSTIARDPTPSVTHTSARSRRRLASDEACGLCRADAKSAPRPGWIASMQNYLENPDVEGTRGEPLPCRRGIIEDVAWFLVVDRNPLAEGHCKLVCKEHVTDILELAEWANRDQRLAQVRDSMSRSIMLSVEVISQLDERIVDVLVISGQEVGAHLHFDLIPRYRMDVPGLRPIAAAKGHYDDLSLSRKRRLWQSRKEHLEEVTDRLRSVARRVIATQGQTTTHITE